MKITVFLTFGVFVILSCSCNLNYLIDNGESNESKVEGLVYATKYKIPIESKIEIFKNRKFISSAISDKKGHFEAELSKKYYGEEITAFITPIKNQPFIDTSFHQIYKIIAECRYHHYPDYKFKTDTFSLVIDESISQLNFLLKGCYANELTDMQED